MGALLAALLFAPTLAALVFICDANVTRRSRARPPRGTQRANPIAEAGTPRSRTDRTSTMTASEDRTKAYNRRKTKRTPPPVSGRRFGAPPATGTTTEGDTTKEKEQTTEATRDDAAHGVAVADKKDKEKEKEASKKQSDSSGSGGELEEKTCKEMDLAAEEHDTQEETLKDTDKSTGRFGTGPAGATSHQWPIGGPTTSARLKACKTPHGKSSVFDVVEKKEDVASEFELDSVKRLQKMSKESITQNTPVGSKEVVVELGRAHPEKPSLIPPSPKKKTKKERKKEEEVRRHNEAIATGHLFRPRKDDETVDECHVDWGEPQPQ